MNQNLTYSHPIDQASLPAGFENARVWRGTIDSPGARNYSEYFAFFNLDDKPITLKATWKQLGLEGGKHPVDERVGRQRIQRLKRSPHHSPAARQHRLSGPLEHNIPERELVARISTRFSTSLCHYRAMVRRPLVSCL